MNQFVIMSMTQRFLLVCALCCSLSAAYTQKIGYVNTQALLADMPEMKVADIQVNAFQNELVSKVEQMAVLFESEYKAYMSEANAGTLSKQQQQQREAALIAKQDELKKSETEIQQKVLAKRDELYKPILEKVKMEIEKLGSEGKYTFIFDQVEGFMLVAAEGDNLLPVLKTRLNIP
jgi:outer membrane protein